MTITGEDLSLSCTTFCVGSEKKIHMTCVSRSCVVDHNYNMLCDSKWFIMWELMIFSNNLIQYWWEKLVCSLSYVGHSLFVYRYYICLFTVFWNSTTLQRTSTKDIGAVISLYSVFENNSIYLIETSWFIKFKLQLNCVFQMLIYSGQLYCRMGPWPLLGRQEWSSVVKINLKWEVTASALAIGLTSTLRTIVI